VRKETGRVSTEDEDPSIKIDDNVMKNLELIEHSFSTYFITIMEKVNNETTTLMIEDAAEYLTNPSSLFQI
jgi:hypothetical protein